MVSAWGLEAKGADEKWIRRIQEQEAREREAMVSRVRPMVPHEGPLTELSSVDLLSQGSGGGCKPRKGRCQWRLAIMGWRGVGDGEELSDTIDGGLTFCGPIGFDDRGQMVVDFTSEVFDSPPMVNFLF
ncbi:hypothetical protein JHK86_004686 [Glycine max]|nr:hypothetical protein JHK86_004686 [Glycine max]